MLAAMATGKPTETEPGEEGKSIPPAVKFLPTFLGSLKLLLPKPEAI